MRGITFDQINLSMRSLCLFREILKDPVVAQLAQTVEVFEKAEEKGSFTDKAILADLIDSYSSLAEKILMYGRNLSSHIRIAMTDCRNPIIEKYAEGTSLSENEEKSLKAELEIIQQLSSADSQFFLSAISYDRYLPSWETDNISISDYYYGFLNNINTRGFGIFSRYMGFMAGNSGLIPVKTLDDERLSNLYGYDLERKKLYDNTKALVQGKEAANILLYGDAGTGKSSSIKACAREFYDQGLRIVEFTKETLHMIPEISGQLSANPLKFIFFIDDLSFSQGDEGFCYLKGLLEGSIAKRPSNIVVYATSNRRHLIEENLDERKGSEVHVNDVLQQNTSLSARFGITITFSRPKKDLYLEIVDSLADKEGIPMDRSLLHQAAEAFAIQQGGRTPRAAKQFVNLVSNNVL